MSGIDVFDPQLHLIKDEKSRRNAWIQATAPMFDPKFDQTSPLATAVSFRCWRLDSIIYSLINAGVQSAERTKAQISHQGIDHLNLHLFLSGGGSIDGVFDDREIPAGSIALYDLSQPSRSTSRGMTGLSLTVPRRSLDARVGDVDGLHKLLLHQPERPLVRLLAEHMINTQQCLDTASKDQIKLLADATVTICNAALISLSNSSHGHAIETTVSIRQYINANISDFRLDIDNIRSQFGISRTALCTLFEAEGGIATYVRKQRLARAMRMLIGSEGNCPQRISKVAYACGYSSPKSFARAFHAHYGLIPRQVDGSHKPKALWEQSSTLLSWIKEL